jgi:uncharacterized protein (DUF1684 family)
MSDMRRNVRLNYAVVTLALFSAAVALTVIGCSGQQDVPEPVAMGEAEHESWEIALVEHRIEKNEAFQDSSASPLPRSELPGFVGLNYYYPERDLRFQVPLEAVAGSDTVHLAKPGGKQVAFLHRGDVTVGHAGKAYTLAVFGPVDPTEGEYLWLPFYDATNEEETYPSGRYLDLTLAPDGSVEVDFNFAYNPLCAYDTERYDCALPPATSRLPFAVPAGELRWRADH